MADFTLELLHAADQEGGIPALEDAPRFSAVLNALKAEDLGNDGIDDNTIVLSSGDAFIPGLFFTASEEVYGGAGRADILIQNELGFQAIAFGNHEFDLGTELLADLIGGAADDPATPEDESFIGAQFPYLSANLDFSTDDNLDDFVVADGQPPQPNSIAASTVIDVNGEKIGVVGATTPTLDIISNPGDVTILPEDFDGVPSEAQLDALAAEIQTDVDALLAANPDLNKVVLLAHMQQIAIEQALAERLTDVDIIVAGGSNTRLVDDTDRLRDGDTNQGPYPILKTDADGNPVAVVNTDGNYKYVGRLVIDFDENGIIVPESYDPLVSGAYATDAQGVADLTAESLVDPDIQAIVDQLRANIEAKESNVFGISEVFLDGDRSSVRIQETNLGNLTADANLVTAREITGDDSIVVSLKNGGGIRDSIGRRLVPPGGTGDPLELLNEEIPGIKPEGGISQNDIANTLRFNNGLTVMDITREGLVAVLEHGVAASSLDDSNTQGRFPQISGVEFSFDLAAEPGDRIQSAAIKDEEGNILDVLVQDGEFVGDPNQSVRIVTLNFLAGEEGDPSGVGGDGYPFPQFGSNYQQLAQPDDAPRTGEATFAPDGSEQDALAEYLFDTFFQTPYDQVDTEREFDERIQNLAFREDRVLDDLNLGSSGLGGQFEFDVAAGEGVTLVDFGGVGRGPRPANDLVDEVDTIRFTGDGLTADVMQLTQLGSDLEITFLGDTSGTRVVLSDFALEDLDNLKPRRGVGNILFSDETEPQDSFDVFDADETRKQIWNRNSVTFLNDLDNRVKGFAGSDDVINGLGGDDYLDGRSGDDILRGGEGDDQLIGGLGDDILTGGEGADQFIFNWGEGVDILTDFEVDVDQIVLGSRSLAYSVELLEVNSDTLVVANNNELIAVIQGVTGLDQSVFAA